MSRADESGELTSNTLPPPPYTEGASGLLGTAETTPIGSHDDPVLRARILEQNHGASTRFVFGPDGQFFFTNYENALWNGASTANRANIKVPYTIALGEDLQYFIAFEGKDGAASWSGERKAVSKPNPILPKAKEEYNQEIAAEDRWNTWHDALTTSISALQNTVVAFGPGRSFYASSTTSTTWHDIPIQMSTEIESRLPERPYHVTLGYDGTYILLWPDNTISHLLSKHYPAVQKILSNPNHEKIVYVALDPFSAGGYYVEYATGEIVYHTISTSPAMRARIKLLRDATMQTRAKRDDRSWATVEDVGKEDGSVYTIGPETNYAFDAAVIADEMLKETQEMMEKKRRDAKRLGMAALACVVM